MDTNLDSTEEEVGLLGRMARLFYAPTETFEAIQRRHSWHDWFIPTLLTAIAVLIGAQMTMPLTTKLQNRAVEQSMTDNQNLSAEQKAQQREVMKKMEGFTSAATLVATPLMIFFMVFITAGIALLVGRYALGGDLQFGQVLAAQGYTSLVLILQTLVLTPLRLAKETAILTMGPGLLFDPGALTGFGGRMINLIDIFVVWQVVLVSIALSIFAKASLGKSMAVMVFLWLVYLVIVAAAMANVPVG